MKKLVLIDSHALIHRAFHALPPLSSPTGQPTNAVYGFLSVLLKMIADVKPDYIAAAFDLAGPTFRHEEYDQYKATRQKAPDELYAQIPMVRRVLEVMGIPIYEQKGFEADDVVGSISKQTQDIKNLQTVIVTGDLDTLQLVHKEKVVVFTLRKGMTDTVIYDEKGVAERYGLTPEQVPDFKGLKGDPSDNIPGVSGIGDKTASALILEFGSIQELYKALHDGVTKKPLTEKLAAKLLEQEDMAVFSKKLATIVRTVDVSFDLERTDWRAHLDAPALHALCNELGFTSMAKRINTLVGAAAQTDILGDLPPAPSEPAATNLTDIPTGTRAAVYAQYSDGGISMLSVTTDGTQAYVIHNPSPTDLADILGRYEHLVGHGLKAIIKLLPDVELVKKTTFTDTQIATWLIGPDGRDFSLERSYFQATQKTPPTDTTQWSLATWELADILAPKLKAIGEDDLLATMEMPLLTILATMENRGIMVDRDTIAELLKSSTTQVAALEKKIHKMAGMEFNIGSPAQLGEVLFERLAIKGRVRKTGGGAPSTAAPELEKLRAEHPIIDAVLEYRELTKLKNTYIEPFPALIAADGRIHTTYNQTGTATGRISSQDPNLQNIPTRTELGQQFRAAFVAAPGHTLVSLDYSQLELRVVAHIANDETMIAAFRDGEDIHTRTASEIFGVPPAQVDKDMRRKAKVLNFGIIYGMGVLGFARAASVPRAEAQKFIDEYFVRFAGVAKYMEDTKGQAMRDGYVSTLFGRRRPLPDLATHIPMLVAQSERMAINHPIQGTGADLVKLAMIAVDKLLRAKGWQTKAHVLLQVHDELVLEVAQDAVDTVVGDIQKTMQEAYTLNVPIVVDVKVGPKWSGMEKYTA